MNSRQRFISTMNYQFTDRVPLFQEGIRDEVVKAWHTQGLPPGADLTMLFAYDEFEEIEPDLDPWPPVGRWPDEPSALKEFRRRLDPNDPRRLPSNWQDQVGGWQDRQHVLWLKVHQGYFLTMGVESWQSFTEAIHMLIDHPEVVHQIMSIQAEFAASLVDRILQDVEVDGAIFSEPIAGNNGPLISPAMYQSFVLQSYKPILDMLESHQVQNIILRTYANPRPILPVVFPGRFNCLWACECNPESMDYRQLRRDFGPGLRLIGGIDTDCLRQDKEAIRREVEEKVPSLLAEGGFIPLADGRVREDVPFENFAFYRRLLEDITSQSSQRSIGRCG
jgi:hypothetical protein